MFFLLLFLFNVLRNVVVFIFGNRNAVRNVYYFIVSEMLFGNKVNKKKKTWKYFSVASVLGNVHNAKKKQFFFSALHSNDFHTLCFFLCKATHRIEHQFGRFIFFFLICLMFCYECSNETWIFAFLICNNRGKCDSKKWKKKTKICCLIREKVKDDYIQKTNRHCTIIGIILSFFVLCFRFCLDA